MTEARTRARGELEAAILQVLWENAVPLTAREVQDVLPGRPAAYTTVLTTLDRLRAKGDVERIGEQARGIRFAVTRSEAERASQAMVDTLAETSDKSATLLRFAGNLDADEVELLREALTVKPAKRRGTR